MFSTLDRPHLQGISHATGEEKGTRFARAKESPWGTPKPRNYLTWLQALFCTV